MTFKSYWNTVEKLIGKRDIVLHLRISTNKIVNEEQTHPYKLGDVQDLEGITLDPVIFMNGSISNQFIYDNMNDTQSYIKDYQQAFHVINQHVLNLIHSNTGCKWCVVTPDDILLSDGFVEFDGKFYSNLKHKEQGGTTYNPDLIGEKILYPSDIIDKELVHEIIEETDFYEDIEKFVRTRCHYQDSCEWCISHCLHNLNTIDDIRRFYKNYVDENSSGDIDEWENNVDENSSGDIDEWENANMNYLDCKYNSSKNNSFVGYCLLPKYKTDRGMQLVKCKKCPCKDFTLKSDLDLYYEKREKDIRVIRFLNNFFTENPSIAKKFYEYSRKEELEILLLKIERREYFDSEFLSLNNMFERFLNDNSEIQKIFAEWMDTHFLG